MNLIVVALIPLLVVGQEIENCLYLTADTVCGPEFKDQPFYESEDSTEGFLSVAEFDEYIRTNPPGLSPEMVSAMGCDQEDVAKKSQLIVYQTSFMCSHYVNYAIEQGCQSNNASTPKLCKSKCESFASSMKDSASSCSNATALKEFQEELDLQCLPYPEESCFMGTELENTNCGWNVINMSITQRYCKLLKKQDSCCNSTLQPLEKDKKGKAQPTLQPTLWRWWVILLVSIGGVVSLVGLFFLVKFLSNFASRKRNSDHGKQVSHKDAESKDGKGALEETLNGDKNINDSDVNTKQDAKATNPTKANEVKKKAGLFNRFRKNFPSLADDIEKGKAESDKSLKSLMKLFGGGKDLTNQHSIFYEKHKPHSADPSLFSTDITPASTVESLWNIPVTALTGQKSEANNSAINTRKSSVISLTSRKSSINSVISRKSVEIGKTVVVVETYEARSRDELTLVIGELVLVETQFDDGWAVGTVEKTKRRGVFPLICTAKIVT